MEGTKMSTALTQPMQARADVDGWEVPVPLTGPPPAPAFPLDALPAWLREMASGVAHFTQTDPTMAGTMALAVLSACAGGRVEVEARPGWREPTNLFLASVAEPGERKSPVYSAFARPLWAAEETLKAKLGPLAEEQAALREIAERAAEKTKSDAARASKDQQQDLIADAVAQALAAGAITVPALPRLITDDATPEALTSLMSGNGGRMAVLSDEGGVFDIMAGRYSSTPNLDPYLKGHAGTPMRVDRRGRESERIDKPALTVGVMMQPSVLRKFGASADMAGKGMVARFLFTIPISRAGWRNVESDPIPEPVATEYHQRVHDLAVTLTESSNLVVLTLSEPAQALRIKQAEYIETQLRPGGALHDMREWGNKLAGATLRLAGLLHIAQSSPSAISRPIDAESMAGAITLAEFFQAHYQAALHTIAIDPGNSIVMKALNTLIDKTMTTFTRRELQRRMHRQLTSAADATAVLETLIQLGWVRPGGDGYHLHPRAREHRESGDTVTNTVETSVFAAHSTHKTVTATGGSPVTPVTTKGETT